MQKTQNDQNVTYCVLLCGATVGAVCFLERLNIDTIFSSITGNAVFMWNIACYVTPGKWKLILVT